MTDKSPLHPDPCPSCGTPIEFVFRGRRGCLNCGYSDGGKTAHSERPRGFRSRDVKVAAAGDDTPTEDDRRYP